jgi:hypothetical protein
VPTRTGIALAVRNGARETLSQRAIVDGCLFVCMVVF